MKPRNCRRIFVLCLFVLLQAFWAFPAQSEACCIYNNTKYRLFIEINRWDGVTDKVADAYHKRCTKGFGGSVTVYLLDNNKNKYISSSVELNVDDHGWLSVYKKHGGRWKVVNKKKNGEIKDIMFLYPE